MRESIFASTLCIMGTMLLCTILNRIELINIQKYITKSITFTQALENIGGNTFIIIFELSIILIFFGIILFIDVAINYKKEIVKTN